jgi:hypothetical protein
MVDENLFPDYFLSWFGLVFTTAANILSLLTIGDLHSEHTGTMEKAKLSLIHPLQPSSEHVHIAVNSFGISSSGFFRE